MLALDDGMPVEDTERNFLFCRAGGYKRFAGEGELVFDLALYDRMVPEGDCGVKAQVLPVSGRFWRSTGHWRVVAPEDRLNV
jgi:hypothetical protein